MISRITLIVYLLVDFLTACGNGHRETAGLSVRVDLLLLFRGQCDERVALGRHLHHLYVHISDIPHPESEQPTRPTETLYPVWTRQRSSGAVHHAVDRHSTPFRMDASSNDDHLYPIRLL